MSARISEQSGRVILGQLRENTGRHMLDSGGAYGRHWERNQLRDFEAEPEIQGRFERHREDNWCLSRSLSVFHFLAAFRDHDEGFQAEFDQFAELPAHEDECWLATMEAWGEVSGTQEILVFDSVTTTRLTNNNRWDENVQVSGSNITWIGRPGSDNEIFMATPEPATGCLLLLAGFTLIGRRRRAGPSIIQR